MPNHVIRISEAEAASDFAGLLARVRAGAEVVIESGNLAVAVIHALAPTPDHLRVHSASARGFDCGYGS
jgi:antitoxin (DNA-binding transcriptional repressor) of toxin-antitoxin stability system